MITFAALPSPFRPGCLLLAAALAACASPQPAAPRDAAAVSSALRFSSASLDAAEPPGWIPLVIRRDKLATIYRVVADPVPGPDGVERATHVMQADSDASASGLQLAVDLDPAAAPCLSWSWKVAHLIETADAKNRAAEDSPARIVLAFDGDWSRLGLLDRILAGQARALSGRELPYATLVYIWEPRLPVGEVVINSFTSRIRKMVAQSGPAGVGAWQWKQRNVVEDFERAFGEAPGRLVSVGILTDTDNTLTQVRAWYGDIGFGAQDCPAR